MLRFKQRFARVTVFVEVFGKAAFRAREADEVIDLVRLRFDVEILFLGGASIAAACYRSNPN